MSFILTTDTACDVFKQELDSLGIPWIPLTFTIKGKTFDDNFNCDDEYLQFYKRLSEGAMPTTSQINSYAHAEFFTEILQSHQNKAIVHLCLSGGLSDTVNSARIAAAEVMNQIAGAKIYIIDSLSATQGHHLLLKEAVKCRDAGTDANETAAQLNAIAPKIQHWFMVDDLHHLKRGGRISGASAVIGTILNIKPVITIAGDGKLSIFKKVKGVKKAIDVFMEMISELKNPGGEFIIVNGNAPAYAEELKKRLQTAYPDCPVSIGWVGPIIGTHTGSGMFGVTFLGKERVK